MDLKSVIIETLRAEVVPAMGCTEPVALALGAAKARDLFPKQYEIEAIDVKVSGNIYKNGLGVGVPNTEEVGLEIAAALGIVGGDPSYDLEILSSIKPEDVDSAHGLIDSGIMTIDVAKSEFTVYIDVTVKGEGHYSRAVIEGKHNFFTLLEVDGNIELEAKYEACNCGKLDNSILFETPIYSLIKTIETIDHADLAFLLEGMRMNEAMAIEGLKGRGMQVGKGIQTSIDAGAMNEDLKTLASKLTAAASDARMDGVRMPVMSSNGSGNNGLTAILPIVAFNKVYPTSDERLAKALAISHMMNCYIKNSVGRLSALCGCGVAAATGASAAICWLWDLSRAQIEGSIKNMIANISGMICDGAKVGCALKLSTSAGLAVQSALLAKANVIVPHQNGIISENVEESIKHLEILSQEGMKITDEVILTIMRDM